MENHDILLFIGVSLQSFSITILYLPQTNADFEAKI